MFDHWTSCANHSYLGVVLQFITEDFYHKEFVLDFCRCTNHSAVGSVQKLKNIFIESRIPLLKLSGCVGDATNSMISTLRDFSNSNPSGLAVDHPCFPHVLKRVIIVAMSEDRTVSTLIREVTKFVTFVHKSPQFYDVIKKSHTTINVKTVYGCVPKAPVPTRWDSVYLMIDSIIFQFDVLNSALAYYKDKCASNAPIQNLESFTRKQQQQIKALHVILEDLHNSVDSAPLANDFLLQKV